MITPYRHTPTYFAAVIAAIASLWGVDSQAQQSISKNSTATATYNVATQPPSAANLLSVTDESAPLSDALIRELRRGGYVLFIRHGQVQPGSIDVRGAGEWWKNCATSQRLAPSALPQAQAIGAALRSQRILFDEVLASEFCRAYDTGIFIGIAAPQRTPALNAGTAFESQKKTPAEQSAVLLQLLSAPVATGKNRLLIGHTLPATAVHPILSILTETQTAIFKPEGNNRFQFVTTLTPGQWQWLGKQVITDQPVVATLQTASQTAPQAAQPVTQPQPVINPANELKGAALLKALRNGGYNLYMRHATSTIGTDQALLKTPMWWENCAIQRNISEQGREQARTVGNAIVALKIPIGEIKTSQFCRVRDTAHLMNLGAIEITEALNHSLGQRVGTDVNAMRYALLTASPPKGTNTLLISHTHSATRTEEMVMAQLSEAEIVVYQPDGQGSTVPIARIPTTEWDNLMKLTNTGKN